MDAQGGNKIMTYKPFFVHGAKRSGRWLITCDHASNIVPPNVNEGRLGLTEEDRERHITYDPGAYSVSRNLGEMLNAPVVASNFSRLVIDPNRGEDDPTLVMQLYDGSVIPANRTVSEEEIERRLNDYHRPYHRAVAKLAARPNTVVVSIHSFTQQLKDRSPRPWHVGVLFPGDDRFGRPLLSQLRAEADLTVGENEPYTGYLPGDAIDRHATANGLPNALIELRNDLIKTEAQQRAWAARLARILRETLRKSRL